MGSQVDAMLWTATCTFQQLSHTTASSSSRFVAFLCCRCRLICARMLSYKGLFCGLSLLFLLLPVVNRCLAVSYFLGYLKDTLIVTSPNGLWRSMSAVSFVCLEWAYIVMGNLWLSMAVKLRNDRLTRFAASRWRPFISAVLSLLPLLTAVSFLSVTGDYSAQLFNAAANLLPVGLLAISFLVLATIIMYGPIIQHTNNGHVWHYNILL